jgi:hypothetical protein
MTSIFLTTAAGYSLQHEKGGQKDVKEIWTNKDENFAEVNQNRR